jgi:hypothetical protein
MLSRRVVVPVLMAAALASGCVPTAAPSGPGTPATVPTPTASATVTAIASATSTATAQPTYPTLSRNVEMPLVAGTYRLPVPGLPTMLITVPDGWTSGFVVGRPRSGFDIPPVGVMFWDIDQVYGHPCQWKDSLFRPGPSVDDLAAALVDIPLRDASEPVDITIDGYSGKFIEWSVPADIETEPFRDYMSFAGCDVTPDGDRAFRSWTGKAGGSERYQQDAGQIDRLWILDVRGTRLVIDGSVMAYATDEERDELTTVVESIQF